MQLTNEDVEEILRLLDGAGYDELHVETGSFSLSLSRTGEGDWVQERAVTREPVIDRPTPARAIAALAAWSCARPGAAGTGLADACPVARYVLSRRSSGAPPFVEIGAPVEPATVVAIVETMSS
jgi:biotin carboxyl carrier protein